MTGKLLTVKDVLARLGISESTFFRILKAREIKGFKVGHVWKFEEKDIDAYIERQRAKAEQGVDTQEGEIAA